VSALPNWPGKLAKDSSGNLVLQVGPNQSFVLAQNELSKGLEPMAGSTVVTVRGQLYKKPAGKQKKSEVPATLKLLILEVQKKE